MKEPTHPTKRGGENLPTRWKATILSSTTSKRSPPTPALPSYLSSSRYAIANPRLSAPQRRNDRLQRPPSHPTSPARDTPSQSHDSQLHNVETIASNARLPILPLQLEIRHRQATTLSSTTPKRSLQTDLSSSRYAQIEPTLQFRRLFLLIMREEGEGEREGTTIGL